MFKNQTATSKFIYLENCIYLEILVKFTKSLLKFTKFTSKFSYIEKNEQIIRNKNKFISHWLQGQYIKSNYFYKL